MTLKEATNSCFAKYATFNGRASRPEFWKFILFVFLVYIALTVINSVIVGPSISQEIGVSINSSGQQSQSINTKYEYGAGWFGNVFGLIILLPWLASGWRRMHDSGRPGWYTLLPTVAFAVSFGIVYLTSIEVPIDRTGFPANAPLPDTIRVPGNIPAFLAAWLLTFASLLTVLWWLCRPSQPDTNQYGPNPNEVPS